MKDSMLVPECYREDIGDKLFTKIALMVPTVVRRQTKWNDRQLYWSSSSQDVIRFKRYITTHWLGWECKKSKACSTPTAWVRPATITIIWSHWWLAPRISNVLLNHRSGNCFNVSLLAFKSARNPKKVIHTLIAYAEAPKVLQHKVTRSHFRPILWLCTAHPYLENPWITGMMEENAKLPNVAARIGRRNGSLPLNRGWNVTNEQASANAVD